MASSESGKSKIGNLVRTDSTQNRPSRDYSPDMDVYSMTSTKDSKKHKGRRTRHGSRASRRNTKSKHRRKKIIETATDRVYSFGMPTGVSDDQCCCCYSRHFLILVGLLAIAVFSVILGLHFVKAKRFKKRIEFASQTPDPHLWNASLAVCGLLIFTHILLILAAVVESPFFIWVYIALNTAMTCLFLIIVAVMMTMLMGAINSEGIKSQCENEFGTSGDNRKAFNRCTEGKGMLPIFALLGGAFVIPTLVIYVVLTLTAISYVHSIPNE